MHPVIVSNPTHRMGECIQGSRVNMQNLMLYILLQSLAYIGSNDLDGTVQAEDMQHFW